MSHHKFPPTPNVFDDRDISPDKLLTYRNTPTLSIKKDQTTPRLLEKFQRSPFNQQSSNLSVSRFSTTVCETTSFLNPQGVSQKLDFSQNMKTLLTDESTINGQQMDVERLSTVVTPKKELPFGGLSVILEEKLSQNPSHEVMKNTHDMSLENNKLLQQLPSPIGGANANKTIHFEDISLNNSVALQPTRPQQEDNTIVPETVEKNSEKAIGIEAARQENKNKAVAQIKEKIQETEDIRVNDEEGNGADLIGKRSIANREEIEDKNFEVQTKKKVKTEEKAINTDELEERVVVEERPAPQLVDKVVNTERIAVEETGSNTINFEVAREDRNTDTSFLLQQEDEATDTNELVNDEKSRALEEIKALKARFLSQLSGFREKLERMKQDQVQSRQTVNASLEKTIDTISDVVCTSIDNVRKQSKKRHTENLSTYQSEISKVKQDLGSLKSFVLYSTDRLNQSLSDYLHGECKNHLHRYIEEITKEKVGRALMDAQSVSTDSSHVTPVKTASEKDREPSSLKVEKRESKSSKKTPLKLDKAVMEGMAYLYENEALKGSSKDSKKLEQVLKDNDKSHLTSDMVLGNLKTGTRGRRVDYKELSRAKKSGKKSVTSEVDNRSMGDNQSVADIDFSMSEKGDRFSPMKAAPKRSRKQASKFSLSSNRANRDVEEEEISIQVDEFTE